jgi:uncharacterized protein (DUF1800 family)
MAAKLLPLDNVDPIKAWQPWQPSPKDPWGRKWAAHLYRRAAFGASREELQEAERLGPQGTLELLLQGRPEASELLETLTEVGQHAARDASGDQLRAWWLYCMLQGGHPLREKMALFWHNHFATSLAKVQNPGLMARQNFLLRRHALGKFGPFLQQMSKDGAMLIWLDSNSNVKGRPNENYARELMELFSLGVGHYTEKDVREAARAFTGWHTDGEEFEFDPRAHDDGPKTVLGHAGNWNGDDVVNIILGQPDTARFLVRKLYHFLISENTTPPDSLLEPLCSAFRKSEYDVAALLKTILSSRHFYSEYAFRQRVKSPVEFVLGAVQAMYRRYAEGQPDYQPLPQQVLVGQLEATGQQLFAPPNVKGWPGGRAWLNTATLLARDNFAQAIAVGSLWTNPPQVLNATESQVVEEPKGGKKDPKPPADLPEEPPPPKALDPARLLQEENASRAEDVVRLLLDMHLPGDVRPDVKAKLLAFVAHGNPTGAALARRARETVHAILTLPEYQLA